MTSHLALVISSLSAGGAERVLSDLANAWAEEGYKVTLVTLASQDEKPFYELSSQINLLQLNQLTSEKANIFTRLKNIYKRVLALRRTFKQLQPDLIISFVDVMNITSLLAARGLRIPVVVAERTHPAYYQLSCLYVWMRRLVYPWASRIVVQTQSAAEYFPKALQSKIAIIPNAVQQKGAPKSAKDVKKPVQKIVSVGRLNTFKGFRELIKAFASVTQSYPNLALTIYGEGEDRKALESLVQSFNLQDKIHLPGTVENIYEALYQADLFVFPSHYEGFPNALCEAMSVGLPVIASNCSGNIEIIQDKINGRLFSIGDIDNLVILLKELIEDEGQRLELSKEAGKISVQYSKIKVLKMWEHVIKEAMHSIRYKE